MTIVFLLLFYWFCYLYWYSY